MVTQSGQPRSALIGASAVPWVVAAGAYAALFWSPVRTTAGIWLSDPDAGHGLLLVPLAVVLAWRSGLLPERRGQLLLGSAVLVAAVCMRYVSGLAAELYSMRLSALGALFGLMICAWGLRQLAHWWLPAVLLFLSMPLPEVLTGTLALPLQYQASELGAGLLAWRHVPVRLAGNVIQLPGHSLFVTEACSGLRSLSALLALGFLIGGLWLRTGWGRALLVLLAIPIAIVLNSVRIFLTGFAVFFIDEKLGDGLMHYTEGWVMFLIAFVVLSGSAWLVAHSERFLLLRRRPT